MKKIINFLKQFYDVKWFALLGYGISCYFFIGWGRACLYTISHPEILLDFEPYTPYFLWGIYIFLGILCLLLFLFLYCHLHQCSGNEPDKINTSKGEY